MLTWKFQRLGGNYNTLNDRLNVEKARIDNLTTLKNGSTTGDAEVADIRVGADGNVYDNAGDAVRNQVGKIHENIDKMINNGEIEVYKLEGLTGQRLIVPLTLQAGYKYHIKTTLGNEYHTIRLLAADKEKIVKTFIDNKYVALNSDFEITENTNYISIWVNNTAGDNLKISITQKGVVSEIEDEIVKIKTSDLGIYDNSLFIQGAISGSGTFSESNTAYVWKDFRYIDIKKQYCCIYRQDLGYSVAVNQFVNSESANYRANRNYSSGEIMTFEKDLQGLSSIDDSLIKIRLTKLDSKGNRLEMSNEDVSLAEIKFFPVDTVKLQFDDINGKIIISNKQESTTDYIVNFKKGKKYMIDVNNKSTVTLSQSTSFNSTSATNLKLWDNSYHSSVIFIADNDYPLLHVWQDSNVSSTVAVVQVSDFIQKSGNVEELELNFEHGDFNAYNNQNESLIDTTKVRTQLFTRNGLYLVTFPDELQATYTARVHEQSSSRVLVNSSRPFSMFQDGLFRVSFSRKDGDALNIIAHAKLLEKIKIYRVNLTARTDYDIVISASDSKEFYKEKSDIVLDGENDTDILAALVGCHDTINILLHGGHYNINKMWTHSDTSKVALGLNEYLINGTGARMRRYICMKGSTPCTPQAENTVKFVVSQELHESLSKSGMYYFILGAPYSIDEQIQRIGCSVDFKNINIIGYYYDKPITYIDTTRCLSTMIDSVNVRSWAKELLDYNPFNDIPNSECCGIRVGRGSDYGIQNYIKHSNYWYCGKGVACNGEHFIFEDVKTHHDYIGWAFGDRKTVGHFEHPNILLGCSIEACYRLMVLTKNGVMEEADFAPDSDNNLFRSTLIAIGTSTETSWQIPINERKEGEVTTQRTEPILEVLKGAYRGRIEIDYPGKPFENGSCQAMKYLSYCGESFVEN